MINYYKKIKQELLNNEITADTTSSEAITR